MQDNRYHPSVRSQISHDIRTPLTGIIGLVNCLNETSMTLQQQAYVEMLRRSAERLLAVDNKIDLLIEKDDDNPEGYNTHENSQSVAC